MAQRRPKLLYVVTLAEVGGAQSYVRDLMSAARPEFDVAIAAYGEGPVRVAAAELGIPFIPLRHVRRPMSAYRDLLGLVELVRLFSRFQPDIVHLNSSKAGVLGCVAGLLARVPIRVFTAHGWAFKATSGHASRIYLWADRVVRPLTTMVVCVSETELAAGIAAGVCTSERSTVIPNAVEVGAAPDREPRQSSGPINLVSVGRLAEPKDFATLMTAVARLPAASARLRVYGDGPLRPAIESQIAELGLEGVVQLAGEVADVRPFLQESDVFVLASLSEGMPMSVLEAMAAGLPVIASDVGGLREVVVQGETGLLVPAGDPVELAASLETLVGNADERSRMGNAGYQRARNHFSLPGWRERHFALYRSLLERDPPHDFRHSEQTQTASE